MWAETLKLRKRWKPRSVFLEGNHEVRGKRCVNQNPELTNLISPLTDLQLDRDYSDIVE